MNEFLNWALGFLTGFCVGGTIFTHIDRKHLEEILKVMKDK